MTIDWYKTYYNNKKQDMYSFCQQIKQYENFLKKIKKK